MTTNQKPIILAVDDEEDAIEMFCDSFKKDYQILCAHNGDEAFQMLKDYDVQLVFSDQRMPGLSGIELLEKVKHEKPEVVRILTTGVTDLQTAIDSINRGNIHRYIPKPWNEEELSEVISDQLRIKSLSQENQRLQTEYEKEKLRSSVKEEILQTVSHEFRTPLTTIIGYMELFAGGHFGKLENQQQEIIDVVFESGLYLRQILENILQLSKIKTESAPLKLEDFILYEVIDDVTKSVQAMADKKRIELIIEKTELPPLIADRAKLKDIFFNLIHNALKFTQQGSVSISAYYKNGLINVQIRDTGPGISPDEQARIFNLFQQTDGYEASLKGLGLGLSIANELVKLHGGTIIIESNLGQGSTFTVQLPLAPPNDNE